MTAIAAHERAMAALALIRVRDGFLPDFAARDVVELYEQAGFGSPTPAERAALIERLTVLAGEHHVEGGTE